MVNNQLFIKLSALFLSKNHSFTGFKIELLKLIPVGANFQTVCVTLFCLQSPVKHFNDTVGFLSRFFAFQIRFEDPLRLSVGRICFLFKHTVQKSSLLISRDSLRLEKKDQISCLRRFGVWKILETGEKSDKNEIGEIDKNEHNRLFNIVRLLSLLSLKIQKSFIRKIQKCFH